MSMTEGRGATSPTDQLIEAVARLDEHEAAAVFAALVKRVSGLGWVACKRAAAAALEADATAFGVFADEIEVVNREGE